jgi:hypothetical protein
MFIDIEPMAVPVNDSACIGKSLAKLRMAVPCSIVVAVHDDEHSARQLDLARVRQFFQPVALVRRPFARHIVIAAYGDDLARAISQRIKNRTTAHIAGMNRHAASRGFRCYSLIQKPMRIRHDCNTQTRGNSFNHSAHFTRRRTRGYATL